MTEEKKSILEHLGVQPVDLREISREGPTVTEVQLVGNYRLRDETWLTTRRVEIRKEKAPGEVTLVSRMKKGVTDQEHDSAYALLLPLVGFRFEDCVYGVVEFAAYVKTPQDTYDRDALRVPEPGDDPLVDAQMCESDHCSDPHPIIRYLPESNYALYRKVAGRRVRVEIGYGPDGYP